MANPHHSTLAVTSLSPPSARCSRAAFESCAATDPARAHPTPTVDFQLNLETETVDQAHLSPAVCVESSATVRDVVQLLQQKVTGAAVICEQQKPVGIFTERDFLNLLSSGGNLGQPITQVMVKNPQTLTKSDSIGKAIEAMSAGSFRRMPIVDRDGKLVGLLKVSGILNYLVDHFPKVVYTLPPDPHYKPNDREGA